MKMKTLFDFTGKTVLVTGSSSGIGEAVALAFLKAGADVIGVSRNFPENSRLNETALRLGRKFTKYNADFSSQASLYSFLEELKAEEKTIDILINNAGMIARKPLIEHNNEMWEKVIAVNLDAQFILAREIGKEMLKKEAGKIVFTCSMLSYQGGINVAGYTASKSAIAGLVRAFANEWAAKGLNINGIAPGYIATENTSALREDENRNKAIIERIPAGRWGTPEDLTGAYLFLSSTAANYINGAILNVDGGWMAR